MSKRAAGCAILLTVGMGGLGCTHHSGLKRTGAEADAAVDSGEALPVQPDVGDDLADSGLQAADGPSIVGSCTTADDCLPVLDYRRGFECYGPKAASLEDIRRDPCLVLWRPHPTCTTSSPPVNCPGGPIPVSHSCLETGCVLSMACTDGKCSFGSYNNCNPPDGGVVDCEDLRITLVNAIAAVQRCYPQASSVCTASLVDPCGCEVPYDISGGCVTAFQRALDDWQNAHCPYPVDACTRPCATRTSAGSACVPRETGSMGSCAWR